MVGAKVAVEPQASLKPAPPIDFVARNEFDFTIKEVADGRDLERRSPGCRYRNADGVIVHNDDRAILENMDSLPFVTPVYKRDLDDRELFHRLSASTPISRSTPAAAANRAAPSACGRRPSAATATAPAAVGHVIEEIDLGAKAPSRR